MLRWELYIDNFWYLYQGEARVGGVFKYDDGRKYSYEATLYLSMDYPTEKSYKRLNKAKSFVEKKYYKWLEVAKLKEI
jgi:hypothetical protein